jgi:hypothetical protein
MIIFGVINVVVLFFLVIIFFRINEPLSPLDRTNNPVFLAYFLHLIAFWFVWQGIALLVFWSKWMSALFPKYISYIFSLLSLLFVCVSLFDAYFTYFKTGFWVKWLRVFSDQQQMDLLIQKGLAPLLLWIVLLLFFAILILILVIRNNKPKLYWFPLLSSALATFALLLISITLIIFRDSFYINGSARFNLAHMSDFLPIIYFGRILFTLLFSVFVVYLVYLRSKKIANRQSFDVK